MTSLNLYHQRIGQGPTILFLHGFMGSSDDWLPIAKLLKNKFDCVLIDLPGHGLTPLPKPFPNTNITWMSEQILRFTTMLNIQNFHLAGYSMGARVALHLALNHPKKLKSLTIESSNPGMSDPKLRKQREQLDCQRAQTIRDHGLPAFLDTWYAAPLFKSLAQHPDFPLILAKRRLGNPHALAHIIQHISPGIQNNLWPHIPNLKVPSLWSTGQHDTKYAPIITRAESLAPRSTLQIIPDAGHNAHFERPISFTSALQNFLAII